MKKGLVGSILWLALAGAIGMGLLAGCVAPMMVPDQATPWYLQSSGAYDTEDGKVFYGVGKAAPLQSHTLQRVSADNQARLEMARLLDRYSIALARTAAAADAGGPDGPDELAPVLKALVRQAMQQAIVTEHWADPQQGRLFALCRLNLVDFEAALKAQKELRADMRSVMERNLERVHTQLSQRLLEHQ
jgi:hypothetical protein